MATVVDTARPALRRLASRASDRGAVHKVMAVAGTRAVKDRFAQLAHTNRNPFGKSAQFWKRMNRGTRWESSSAEAAVVMPREVAQRYYGGTITPKGGRKALTIPAKSAAYRRKASTLPGLVAVIFRTPRGSARNVIGALIRPSKNRSTLDVFYWLMSDVTQRGNPAVLPTTAEFDREIQPAIREYLLRETRQPPGTGSAS